MAIQCKNCAGLLVFDPDVQKLTCRNCGGQYDVTHTDDTGLVDLQKIFDDRSKLESQDINVYMCSSCGGSIIVDDVEITSSCPFCGNKGVIFDRVAKRRRPDGVIPFAFGASKAEEKARSHLMGAAFLTKKARNMEFVRTVGIYVPYYITSAEYKGVMTYEKVTRGKNGQEVDRDHIARSVRCLFDRLTLEASDALVDEAGLNLEPFDLDGLRVFEEGYLQGFCSDMADEDPDALYRKAKEICTDYVTNEIQSNKIAPTGYHCIGNENSLKFRGKAVYALFPVWFVTGEYRHRPVTVLVNGQTGKAVGGPSYSKLKFVPVVAASSILPVALLSAAGALGSALGVLLLFSKNPLYGIMIFGGLISLASMIIGKAGARLSRVHKVLKMSSSERLIRFSGRRDV